MKRIILPIISLIIFLLLISITLSTMNNNKIKPPSSKISKTGEVIDIDKIKVEPKIKVYISKSKEVKELDIEDYVRGVVCGEMPAEFGIEALKAQAVAARTYGIAHMVEYGGTSCNEANGGDVCDTVHCQVYMSKEDRFKAWPTKSLETYWNKISKAVEDTKGEVITYNGELIKDPYYFSTSSGKTENSIEVFGYDAPYLKSVSSLGEDNSPKFKTTVKASFNEVSKKINAAFPKAKLSTSKIKDKIKILKRSSGGNSVLEIKLGDITVSGAAFRKIFDLSSSNFDLKFNNNYLEITCHGYGHDVGMSQWGANVMAKGGSDYKEILKHYYINTDIKKLINP